jgi:hydrogenase maturation protease
MTASPHRRVRDVGTVVGASAPDAAWWTAVGGTGTAVAERRVGAAPAERPRASDVPPAGGARATDAPPTPRTTDAPPGDGPTDAPGWLVVGLGSLDRGDDAVGPVVARRVAELAPLGVRVLVHEDPTDLVESMTGASGVVVVDAVWSPGTAPGELLVLEAGEGAGPLPEDAWARTGRGGTHAFGLAAAVELARALRRLPHRVVLVGVAAGGFDHGAPLSPGVAGAVGAALDAVLRIVRAPTLAASR